MRVFACFAAVLLMATASVSWAQDQDPQERVTAKVDKVPLRQALKQMLAGTSVRFRVDANVPDPIISLNLRDVHPTATLRLIVRMAQQIKGAEDLTLVREGDLYRLKLDPAARAQQRAAEGGVVMEREPAKRVDAAYRDPKLERKITRSFKSQTLRAVADALFAGTGSQYTFSGKSEDLVISLELKDVSLLDGLRQATAAAAKRRPGVGLWRDGDVYVLGPQTGKKLPDQP